MWIHHGLLSSANGSGFAKSYNGVSIFDKATTFPVDTGFYRFTRPKTWLFRLDTTAMNPSNTSVIYFCGGSGRFSQIFFRAVTQLLTLDWFENNANDLLRYETLSAIPSGDIVITIEYDGFQNSNSTVVTVNSVDYPATKVNDDNLNDVISAARQPTWGVQDRPGEPNIAYYEGLIVESQLIDRTLTNQERIDIHSAKTAFGIIPVGDFYFACDLNEPSGNIGFLPGTLDMGITNTGGNVWVPFSR